MIDILLLIVGSLGLMVGTITDFQKREVADWINFGMIFAGIGLRVIASISSGDWFYTLFGLLWLGLCYLFGLLMYYTGQWGGGDCKMIMGLGALFGTFNPNYLLVDHSILASMLGLNFSYNISFILHFLINSFLLGSIYGLIYTLVLMIKFWPKFKEKFLEKIKEKQAAFLFALAILILIFGYIAMYVINDFAVLLQLAVWVIVLLPILLVFIRAIEQGCMIRDMKIKDLTEGEWIVEDVRINNKYVTGPKELGITLEQIKTLKDYEKKGKIDAVKVKIGIPFVPAFLLAFVATIFFGNLFLFFLF